MSVKENVFETNAGEEGENEGGGTREAEWQVRRHGSLGATQPRRLGRGPDKLQKIPLSLRSLRQGDKNGGRITRLRGSCRSFVHQPKTVYASVSNVRAPSATAPAIATAAGNLLAEASRTGFDMLIVPFPGKVK
eukprot:3306648-Pleurochrysis_carterae.AAC.1